MAGQSSSKRKPSNAPTPAPANAPAPARKFAILMLLGGGGVMAAVPFRSIEREVEQSVTKPVSAPLISAQGISPESDLHLIAESALPLPRRIPFAGHSPQASTERIEEPRRLQSELESPPPSIADRYEPLVMPTRNEPSFLKGDTERASADPAQLRVLAQQGRWPMEARPLSEPNFAPTRSDEGPSPFPGSTTATVPAFAGNAPAPFAPHAMSHPMPLPATESTQHAANPGSVAIPASQPQQTSSVAPVGRLNPIPDTSFSSASQLTNASFSQPRPAATFSPSTQPKPIVPLSAQTPNSVQASQEAGAASSLNTAQATAVPSVSRSTDLNWSSSTLTPSVGAPSLGAPSSVAPIPQGPASNATPSIPLVAQQLQPTGAVYPVRGAVISHEPMNAAPPRANNELKWRVYKVRDGDTLAGIAQQMLGDPNRAWELQEANRGVVQPNGAIPLGAVLVIPPVGR